MLGLSQHKISNLRYKKHEGQAFCWRRLRKMRSRIPARHIRQSGSAGRSEVWTTIVPHMGQRVSRLVWLSG